MKKPKVIITRRLQDRVEKRMKELFNVDLSRAEYPISKQELLSAVKDADILVPTIGDKTVSYTHLTLPTILLV